MDRRPAAAVNKRRSTRHFVAAAVVLSACGTWSQTSCASCDDTMQGDSASTPGAGHTADEPAPDAADQAWQPQYPAAPPPGMVLWGSSVAGNADPAERHEDPAGATLSVRRTFFQWRHRSDYLPRTVAVDHAVGRLPWVSIKPPSWQAMADGDHDDEIDELLRSLVETQRPVWLTVHHEPEGGGGVNEPDDPAWPAGHVAMNQRVRTRMDALGADNIALVPVLMAYTWDPQSGRDPDAWWQDGIYDLLGVDTYADHHRGLLDDRWQTVRRWADDNDVDVAVGEWGLRGTDADAAAHVRAWYDAAIASGDDGQGARVVALSAFDSDRGGSWTLQAQQLRMMHALLRDPRTYRIDNASPTERADEHGRRNGPSQ